MTWLRQASASRSTISAQVTATLVTTVKIVRPLCNSRRDRIIVQSMIRMAHDLGYRVVAEGIESREAYDMLAEWGCDEGQGFQISHPMPIGSLAS